MFSLICLVLSSCIWFPSGYSIYHSCRCLSGHLHNSHFNPFKSGKPNHNNRLQYFSYTVIPYSTRGPFCIYLTVCLVVFFFRLFLVACALSFSRSLSLSLCPLLLTFVVFPTCHGLCLPNKEWERRGRNCGGKRCLYFPFNCWVFSFFVPFKSILLSKNSGAQERDREEGTEKGGGAELKSYLSRPEHYFIICCQSWLPLRLPDETALS